MMQGGAAQVDVIVGRQPDDSVKRPRTRLELLADAVRPGQPGGGHPFSPLGFAIGIIFALLLITWRVVAVRAGRGPKIKGPALTGIGGFISGRVVLRVEDKAEGGNPWPRTIQRDGFGRVVIFKART